MNETKPVITELEDLEVWRELTQIDADMYEEEPPKARYTQNELTDEIFRRWGPESLERAAQVITGGGFTAYEELDLLKTHGERWMQLVRGELTPDEWFED